MKKTLAILLALVLALGCTSAFAEQTKTLKFGISIPQLSNAAWRVWADMAIKACEELGVEYEIADAAGDDNKQYNQIVSLCSSGVDGIILNGNSDAVIESMLDVCDEAGVPCVVTGRSPGFLPSEYDGDSYLIFVGCDWEISGYMQAEALYNAGGRKVFASGGMKGVSVADARFSGLELFVSRHPDMEIVDGQRTAETRTQGMENMENWLSAYKTADGYAFDSVWTTNDDTALGCLEALTAAGLNGKILLGGIDVLDESREAMHKGEQVFDTFSDPYSIEYASVIPLYDYLHGFEPEVEQITCGRLNITPDNIADYEAAFVTGTCDVDAKNFSRVFNPDAHTADLAAVVDSPVPVVTEIPAE